MSALAEALIAAQLELPTALKRDAANDVQGYRYLTLDALIAATRPILNKHGLTITQWPTTLERHDAGHGSENGGKTFCVTHGVLATEMFAPSLTEKAPL